jgi:hypothetical protein
MKRGELEGVPSACGPIARLWSDCRAIGQAWYLYCTSAKTLQSTSVLFLEVNRIGRVYYVERMHGASAVSPGSASNGSTGRIVTSIRYTNEFLEVKTGQV